MKAHRNWKNIDHLENVIVNLWRENNDRSAILE